MYILRVSLALLISCFGLSTITLSQLDVSSNREDGRYSLGESAVFNVIGEPLTEGTFLFYYDELTPIIETGIVDFNEDGEASVNYTASEPGVVFCKVDQDGDEAVEAIVFGADEIDAIEEEPADFDAFWNEQKALLAAIPLDPQITFLESDEYTSSYRINLGSIDDRRVYGYVSIPNGEGPFPAILSLPSFGSSAGITQVAWPIAERGGAISLAVSIHNAEPDEEDPNAYEPDDISDRDVYYYRYAVLGIIRMIDYLFTRNDFDGEHVGLTGVSQGGGLAMIVAGLDSRVKLITISKNVLAEHAAYKHGLASGFPFYMKESAVVHGTIEHENQTLAASKYYDAVYHARRYQGATFMVSAYQDLISPAATVLACYNQLRGPKIMINEPYAAHNPNPPTFNEKRFDFYRRYFEAMQSPPWPWPDTTLGLFINAGSDTVTVIDEPIQLNGWIALENENNLSTFQPSWQKISGPGEVLFSASTSFETQVSFSEAGTYVLELAGRYDEPLETENLFYTLADQIEVIVESPNHTEEIASFLDRSVAVFPNPVSNTLMIQAENIQAPLSSLELISANGQQLIKPKISAITESKYILDVSRLSKGIYFIRLGFLGMNRQVSKKIIVER